MTEIDKSRPRLTEIIYTIDLNLNSQIIKYSFLIRYLYGDQRLTAWGGPFRGIVSDIPANQWTSYLPVADHPEYPSATTGACVSHAEAMRNWLGDDDLSWDITFEAGESRIEPGALPAYNQTYRIKTFTDFAYECGESRMWAGVHFQVSFL